MCFGGGGSKGGSSSSSSASSSSSSVSSEPDTAADPNFKSMKLPWATERSAMGKEGMRRQPNMLSVAPIYGKTAMTGG